MCSCGPGFARKRTAVILSLCLAATALPGESPTAPAGGGPKGWDQLHLVEAAIAGTRGYYEKDLEPNLPVFEQELTKFLAARANLADLLTRRREIIMDMDRILGLTEAEADGQSEAFAKFGSIFSSLKVTFYLVRGATALDFLRAGGQLPNCRYDPKSGGVVYQPRIEVPHGGQAPENWDFCLPIPTGEPFDKFVPSTFTMLAGLVGSWAFDVGMGALTQATIIKRARPTDPYWRWFDEGFALAITLTLIEKYVDKEAAQEFAAHYNCDEYRDLQKEINLRYWMVASCCPYDNDVPVPRESRICAARSAYSLLEASQLIDVHGIDCIRAILDKIAAQESRKGSDLLAAIKNVTGEDMEQRLGRYQTFQTSAEGMSKYTNAYQAAFGAKNLEQMFDAGMRVMELRGDPASPGYLQCFKEAARLLFLMGREEAGDAAMRQALALYSKDPAGRRMATEMFVMYSLECNHPRKAAAAAEELLAKDPGNVPALTAKMLATLQDGNVPQAQKYARQVRILAEGQSIFYQVASQVLVLDPNHPPAYKGAVGPK
jgi:hypothetical protein